MTTAFYKLRGDWMRDGYIDNLGMPIRCTIAVVDGKAYTVDPITNMPELNLPHLELDEDGAIRHVGARGPGFFSADDSEIDRVGRSAFGAA